LYSREFGCLGLSLDSSYQPARLFARKEGDRLRDKPACLAICTALAGYFPASMYMILMGMVSATRVWLFCLSCLPHLACYSTRAKQTLGRKLTDTISSAVLAAFLMALCWCPYFNVWALQQLANGAEGEEWKYWLAWTGMYSRETYDIHVKLAREIDALFVDNRPTPDFFRASLRERAVYVDFAPTGEQSGRVEGKMGDDNAHLHAGSAASASVSHNLQDMSANSRDRSSDLLDVRTYGADNEFRVRIRAGVEVWPWAIRKLTHAEGLITGDNGGLQFDGIPIPNHRKVRDLVDSRRSALFVRHLLHGKMNDVYSDKQDNDFIALLQNGVEAWLRDGPTFIGSETTYTAAMFESELYRSTAYAYW
jgi:hypothetical protein